MAATVYGGADKSAAPVIIHNLQSVVSQLPPEKRVGAEQVITPVIGLIAESSGGKEAIGKAADEVRNALSTLSIASYYADKSPFVPPLNKVQYLCGDDFSLAYTSQSDLRSYFRINGRDRWMEPGHIATYESASQKLAITYLEYKKEMKGPVLKYECKPHEE